MRVLPMSIQAGLLITMIIVFRAIALNKLPKKSFLALWSIALLRMLIPFSLTSKFSVYNIFYNVSNNLSVDAIPTVTPAPAVDTIVEQNDLLYGHEKFIDIFEQNAGSPLSTLAVVWLIGVVILLSIFSLLIFKSYRALRFSIPVKNDSVEKWLSQHRLRRTVNVLQSDRITVPLTIGIVRPRILLPTSLDLHDQNRIKYILTHEYFHICRFDILWKLLVLLAVCIHWFNPLSWVMLILFNRDLEISCDERVLKHLGECEKAAYAHSLIDMAEWKSSFSPIHSYFSKNTTEERIVAIMKYKKPTLWATLLVASVALVSTVCLLSNPSCALAADERAPQPTADKSIISASTQGDAFDDTFAFQLAPGESEFYGEEIVFTAGQSINYRIVWTGLGTDIAFGLLAQDGTEYLQPAVVEGGGASGTIDNIPEGIYQVFVRNIETIEYPNTEIENLTAFGVAAFSQK